jgi:alpha-mannosidase
MEMSDRPPYVKTLLNLDARAYELMSEKFPEVAERLKKYLAAGKVELIGGTYSQPMGTTVSGESNIRQIAWGRELIRKTLGYEMVTFLEEEDFSHPQVPQIVAGAGYRYASLAQVDTWGHTGIPVLEFNVINWQGKDGTTVPCVPKNSLFGYSPDLKKLASSAAFPKLRALGKPLIFAWEEFGWEPEDEPAYREAPEKYRKFAAESSVEFVTLKEYLDKYGTNPGEPLYLNMDAWSKLLTWGLGGDQLRILDRKVEGLLLAAERFDAIAGALGETTHEERLEKAWRDLMTAQSHDVGLCEYSRWDGDRMAVLDRVEDKHNFTWGAIGYNHLDAAQQEGQRVLDSTLGQIVKRIGSQSGQQDRFAITVFNPSGWERTNVASVGRIYPVPQHSRDAVVKDASGRVVPSQIIKSVRGSQGNLVAADVAFLADQVPSVGYDTYYLEFTSGAAQPPATDLRIDEAGFVLENDLVRVKVTPRHGAITSLIDKRTGLEVLNAEKSPFPVFKGRPDPNYPVRSVFLRWKYPKEDLVIPAIFDSSKSQAAVVEAEKATASPGIVDWRVIGKSDVQWIEKGPLRATIRTRHRWPLLKFEVYVTLCASSPHVEVVTRVLAEVPPPTDKFEANGGFPSRIKEGYWLTLAPGFEVTSVVRDFPLGVEPTTHGAFQALTFLDLLGKECGLLVLHAGTQYFNRTADGIFSNLLMREWESFWSGDNGWPRYCEYRHALIPHGPGIANSERLRAAAEFTQKLIAVVGTPQAGSLPKRKGFVSISPESVQLTAFRKKPGAGYEVRVVEVEGQEAATSVELPSPVTAAIETNLLGNKVAEVSRTGSRLDFKIQPWKIRTFEVG